MQPRQQSSRIDLVDLKTQIVKKIGVERSKKYFYALQRFLSSKLSKSDLDKSCFRLLGRENLSLHNQLIRSILKNACLAKTQPPAHKPGPAKSVFQFEKSSPGREDGHELTGFTVPPQNQNMPSWSNGVLPMSPRKARSGVVRDQKLKDRPSLLGLNGKLECHQSAGAEDSGDKIVVENGELPPPYDYERPGYHFHAIAEQPERKGLVQHSTQKQGPHDRDQTAVVEDREHMKQPGHLGFQRGSLVAPLGIPFCSASVGGARKALPVTATSNFLSYYESCGLSDSGTLKKHMEQIAAAQGLEGVSMECANMLNKVLDIYLKRLIKSCVELVGARSQQGLRKLHVHKQQVQAKLMNGMWPGNHLVQSSVGQAEVMHEWRPSCSISLLDFKVAMELNPQQLGEDWPLLLEKICMHAFED